MSEPQRRLSAAWLVPLAVLFVVVWILIDTFHARGVEVVLKFPDGHGLGRGDMVRCRGIEIGVVGSVRLDEEGVEVVLDLEPLAADRLAREGSRWWIVRPQVDWSRISGLDSIVGPRFIEVDPPAELTQATESKTVFRGLEEAPILGQIAAGDLELVLVAENRGSLHTGSAVLYRGVQIGTILSTALADDSRGVIAKVLVREHFVPLVRSNSRFFQAGAFDLDVGFTGLRARLDSLETLFVGGVSMATPTLPGDPVVSGQEFAVHSEPEDNWLEWRPRIELAPSE